MSRKHATGITLISLILLLASSLVSAGPIYSVNRAIGAGSVIGTIETDGTIGSLGAANILDWNLTLDDGTGSTSITLLGPSSGSNSALRIVGSSFTASVTDLWFDFSNTGNYVLFQNPNIGSEINYWCLDGALGSSSCAGNANAETVKTSGQQVILGQTGVTSIATTTNALNPNSSVTGDDPDGTLHVLGDAFGAGADTWDDWLFVGTPRETTFRDGDDYQDGAVYIYQKSVGTYVLQQKLTIFGSSGLSGDGSPLGDRFGSGVAAAGGWLFVGAVNDQDFPNPSDPREGLIHPDDPPFQFAGQVHVYAFNGSAWDFVQTLSSPSPGTNGSFGSRSQASHITLDSKGQVAVIGEFNNFAGGVGQLHTYHLKKGIWKRKQSIDAPFAEIDTFGDDLVFANDKYLVAGGSDTSDDGLTSQGYVFVYEAKDKNKPGKFFAMPAQTIAGPVVAAADCEFNRGFGRDGLDAAGGVVVVADPCASGAAGSFAGAISVYRLGGGAAPLVLEETIEGDEPNLYFGSNFWGSRHAVAVSDSGERILIGSPRSTSGFLDDGADVRVYVDGPGGWAEEFRLGTATLATGEIRAFGDTVFFADDETAFVRENNFLSPVVTGRKGQGLFHDLTP